MNTNSWSILCIILHYRSSSRTRLRAENIEWLVFLKANVAYFKWLVHATGTLFEDFDFLTLFRWYINIININNITMFCVIQLFIFVFIFGRIVHGTIRIRPNSLKPLFGTSLFVITCCSQILWRGRASVWNLIRASWVAVTMWWTVFHPRTSRGYVWESSRGKGSSSNRSRLPNDWGKLRCPTLQ